MSEKGFFINDNEKIEKFSGPVSMGMYMPNTQTEFFRGYNAPIFILFGDVHFSTNNLCDVNVPKKHRIYKIEFFQILSSVLQDNEVIDFYTEGHDLTNEYNYILGQNQNDPLIAQCNLVIYINQLKQANKLNQLNPENQALYKSIEKIKWHHTDIRFWTQYSPQNQDATQEIQKRVSQIKQQKKKNDL
jgi:hypothetical protein